MIWEKGEQYQPFLETLYTIFIGLSPTDQDEILYNLNKIRIGSKVDPELKEMYYEEFEEVYGDLGEEDAIDELTILAGCTGLGSIEKLKYLTTWYDARVVKGLYRGSI